MIYDKVVKLLCDQLPVTADQVTMESRLFEDLKADSANVMVLIMDLETEFDITVDDEILATIKTVGDIVKYLEEHVEN